jgi:hypothetical protein
VDVEVAPVLVAVLLCEELPGVRDLRIHRLRGPVDHRLVEVATVVSADRDLTHDETVAVLDVDEYRN